MWVNGETALSDLFEIWCKVLVSMGKTHDWSIVYQVNLSYLCYVLQKCSLYTKVYCHLGSKDWSFMADNLIWNLKYVTI